MAAYIISSSNPVNVSARHAAIYVLGDALLNLTEHFTETGMSERKATALANVALKIDAAQLRADMASLRREHRAERREHERFRAKAAAVTAAFAAAR